MNPMSHAPMKTLQHHFVSFGSGPGDGTIGCIGCACGHIEIYQVDGVEWKTHRLEWLEHFRAALHRMSTHVRAQYTDEEWAKAFSRCAVLDSATGKLTTTDGSEPS